MASDGQSSLDGVDLFNVRVFSESIGASFHGKSISA